MTSAESRRRGPISLLLAGAVVVYACGDAPTDPGFEPVLPAPPPALAVDVPLLSAAPLRVCGDPTVVALLGADALVVGRVTVTNDEHEVRVLMETEGDWELSATHVGLADSPEGFPLSPSGLPQVGRFPYSDLHAEGTTAFATSAPLADLGLEAGDDVLVAAHAELIDRNDPGDPDDDRVMAAWGEGTPFSKRPQGDVGRYFGYAIQDCTAVAQTVGPEGGTVVVGGAASPERATLEIPPGALAGPVVITVRAIPLSEISLPGSTAPAFVEGTAYDFGPDGLQFLVPVLLTISYDEADLGGEPESALTMFRVSSALERIAGSSVDEEANQVSALVEHFTVYVTAIDDGYAVALDEAVGVTDEVAIRVLSTLRSQVAEAIGVGDEVTITVRPAPRSNVAESVGITDEVTINVRPVLRSSVAESVGITDQVAITVRTTQRSSVAESVAVTDRVAINVLSSIAADVSEAIGVADDVTITVVPVGPTVTADLAVPLATAPTTPVPPGTPAQVQAYVRNLGPDAVTDARAIYRAFGDVVAGALEAGCTETPSPGVGDVEIVCDVGALAVSQTLLAPRAFFVPQSDGTVTVRAAVASSALDANAANDEYVTQFTAGTGADLQVVRVDDAPDPVSEGGDVAFDVTVRSNTSGVTVDGATLQVLFTGGDATFRSADAGCAEISGGVECALPSLAPFTNRIAHMVMTLPTGDQTITATATIVAPAGIIELNPSNNVGSAQTTVVARPPAQLQFGDVVEGALPPGPDSATFSFTSVPGEWARVQVAMLTGANAWTQLVIFNPAGEEIFPAPSPRGRATDLSSANHVFQMQLAGTYTIKLTPGTGVYQLGLGTGAGRLDLAYGPDATGVTKVPAGAGTPFWDMARVGDDVIALGDEEMWRFDMNGAVVTGFGSGGAVNIPGTLGAGRYGHAFRVQPDGKIVVAARGPSPYPWVIARYEADGTLDTTFGTGGMTVVQLGNRSFSMPYGVRFQQNGPDLDILVGGNGGALQEQLAIVRLDPDGSLDSGFGTNGIVWENGGFGALGMDVQADGSIVVNGTRAIRRYTPSGARDATFGTDGLIDLGILGNVRGLTVLPDDRILMLGEESGDAMVMLRTASGLPDGSFSGDGVQLYDFGLIERFQAATPDGSGNLIVVGYQRTVGGDYEHLVTRMSMSGMLDPGFAVSGYLTEYRVDDARAVAIDALGGILVGGRAVGTIYGVELTRHIPN